MAKSTGFIDFTDQHGPSSGQGKLHIHAGPRCHETHPDLALGGGTLIGGNCHHHERHKDVDLYVALDGVMAHPLFDPGKTPARCIYYPITNMSVPQRPDKFKALIDMLVAALAAGDRIHVGCIGGHGRTGMVVAAVVARLGIAGPENDAIGWTREHYCQKAVETKAQEGFLAVHFGAKLPVAAQTPYQVDKRHGGF